MTADAPITIPTDELGQPDLHRFIRQHGGYAKVPPAAWRAWDAANERWQAERRERLGRPPPPPPEPVRAEPCQCGAPGKFGYKDKSGKLVWYCTQHRLSEWWADARVGPASPPERAR
jgi:hypothetical protein